MPRRRLAALLLVLAILLPGLAACGRGREADPAVAALASANPSQWRFAAWQARRWWTGEPRPATPGAIPAPLPCDGDRLHRDRLRASATWIGHATVLLRLGGRAVLTDPIFSPRASPLPWVGPRRLHPPALAVADLPHIDLVVLSHDHADHLDPASLRALAAQPGGAPRIAVPLGLEERVRDLGFAGVDAFAWWEERQVAGLRLAFVPTRHWSGVTPWSRGASLWGGWIIDEPEAAGRQRVLFAGDTAYDPIFADIGRRYPGIDLALLPVGAYRPRDLLAVQHTDPGEAVRLCRDLGARRAIGIHWGTFPLGDESPDEVVADLRAAIAADRLAPGRFTLLRIGQTAAIAAPADADADPFQPLADEIGR